MKGATAKGASATTIMEEGTAGRQLAAGCDAPTVAPTVEELIVKSQCSADNEFVEGPCICSDDGKGHPNLVLAYNMCCEKLDALQTGGLFDSFWTGLVCGLRKWSTSF